MDKIKCEAALAAADYGNLTTAAAMLGYTQPGITRMLRSLEKELGFSLFIRTSKGVSLTNNGRMMLPYFRDIVRTHQRAEELGSEIHGILNGVLTIGSYFSIASILLPTILQEFQKEYPKVSITLREGGNRELSSWLAESSIDCCFSAKPSASVTCDWLPLWQDELVAWLPADHPQANDDTFPLKDLEKYPFIITLPEEDTDIDRLLSAEDLHPDIRFSTADVFTSWRMVEAGLGISFNNRLTSAAWQENVVTVPFKPTQFITLGIAAPSLKDISPATRQFIKKVKTALSKNKMLIKI
jgi:DNA-binding transcriptional LysR family regulator